MITRKDADKLMLDFIVQFADLSKNILLDNKKEVVDVCEIMISQLLWYAQKDDKLNYLLKQSNSKEFIREILAVKKFDKKYYLYGTYAYIIDYSRELQFCFIIDLYRNIQIIQEYYLEPCKA